MYKSYFQKKIINIIILFNNLLTFSCAILGDDFLLLNYAITIEPFSIYLS